MTPGVHLISTPCSFLHSYESERLVISQISSNAGDSAYYGHPGPFQHHFYALQVPVSQEEQPGVFRWDLYPDDVVAILSLFFGKRILHHGPIWLPPFWSLPELQSVRPNSYHSLEFYSGEHSKTPRREPDWREVARLSGQIRGLEARSEISSRMTVAAKAYAESLTLLPFDRELAYFRLIQALESVIDPGEFTEEERYSHDASLMAHLEWLESLDDPRGKKVASFLRSRLYQIKRSVILWVSRHIRDDFYSTEPGAITSVNLMKALSGAYDLRSRYVHTGEDFGVWIDPARGRCEGLETVPRGFSEICPDKTLRKTLQKAPSYLGLERLVRYLLVSILEKHDGDS